MVLDTSSAQLKAGHDVVTPTLTGRGGERAHLLSAETGIDTFVDDVVAVLEC